MRSPLFSASGEALTPDGAPRVSAPASSPEDAARDVAGAQRAAEQDVSRPVWTR